MNQQMTQEEAMLALQVELEELYSKHQLMYRLRKEFAECPEFDFCAATENAGVPVKFGIDLLCQMALHKRCSLPTLIGVMYHHLKDAQATADMLLKCVEAEMVDWLPQYECFVVAFPITDELQLELDKFQFPLPMVVPPLKVTNNSETGYWLVGGSLILKNNHHNDDICLDHINRMNAIKFTLNMDMVKLVRNRWRNLDKKKPNESRDDFDRRKRAFQKYDRTAHDVIAKLHTYNNEFYLTHKYDKRGRTYCQGYHVNYQGTAWNKAVIEFHDKEICK